MVVTFGRLSKRIHKAPSRHRGARSPEEKNMDPKKEVLTRSARLGEIRVEARDGKLYAMGAKKIPALLGPWAFTQLCGMLDAPESYLETLSPTLCAQNLNHGLSHLDAECDDEVVIVLVRTDEDQDVWALTNISWQLKQEGTK